MYVVLIALLYLLMMMVVTAESVLKGVMILLFGSALIALIVYLLDSPRRLRSGKLSNEDDKADSHADE